MKIRRFIAVFLSALILCGVLTVPAAALEDPAIRAKAALLVEAETGTILYDKNIHDELSIASTTKIMSALLVFEAIDRGELRLDQQVTATATAHVREDIRTHLALQGYESFANERQGCDRANMVADLERADFFFHKFAIETGIRSACGGIELERDVDIRHFSL